jgi:hypothetical protein
MDTLTANGSGVGTVPPTGADPKRRRRWPRVVLASALITLSGLVAYAGWFVSNYQPLSGSGGMYGVGPEYTKDLGLFTSPHGENFQEYSVRYPGPGHHFGYRFTLWNTGPVAVEVKKVEPWYAAPDLASPLLFTGARFGPTQGPRAFQVTGGEALHPFTLAGGAYSYVEIENRFARCSHSGLTGDSVIAGIDVTYSVFGITRHTTVYPDYTIVVGPIGNCDIHEG